MQRIFNEPCLGIEITSRALRLGLLSRSGDTTTAVNATSLPLPAGMVTESYALTPFGDREGLVSLLRSSIQKVAARPVRRAGLSIPDGIFRVQILEFDDLPSGSRDRDRLIRWRVEKGAAFDTANTVLRYQVHERPEKGYSVLACIAKKDVIAHYESVLTELGLEPWAIVPSSLNVLNLYAPALLAGNASGFALAWITEGSYVTIIMERGGPRFYRYKELRTGPAEDVTTRLLRELDDSLHFYMHRDRQQASEVSRLSLAGDPALLDPLVKELKQASALEIEALAPGMVIPSTDASPAMAAALGAGGSLC
ncbi:MAG: type IV pilus biogenesis protein PilM [Nitrospirota bacterium]